MPAYAVQLVTLSHAAAPPAVYPGINGFLGTRASIMLDVVFVGLFAVVLAMGISIYLVRYRRNFLWHKRIQLSLGAILLLAITGFEVDMRFLTQWEVRAEGSPYFIHDYSDATPAAAKWGSVVGISLLVHLFFALPTALVWIFVIVQALRYIPNPPGPCAYSPRHKFWARLAAIEMTLTAITGWIFYYLAFVA